MRRHPTLKLLLTLAVVAAVYGGLVRLALELAIFRGHFTPLWPAPGFGMTALARLGPIVAVPIFLAKLATSWLFQGFPWPIALGTSIGSAIEALVGGLTLRAEKRAGRLPGATPPVRLLLAATAGASLAATCSIPLFVASGIPALPTATAAWLAWWASNTLGTLTIVPLLLCVGEAWDARRWPRWGWRETVVVAAGLAALAALFGAPRPLASVFLLFPLILVSGAWCRPLATDLLLLATLIVGGTATVEHRGPFALGVLSEDLLNLQLFYLAFVITGRFLVHLGPTLRRRLPMAVALVGWAATAAIVVVVDQHKGALDEATLRSQAAQAEDQLRERFEQSVLAPLTHGGRILTRSGRDDVTPESWASFVDDVDTGKTDAWLLGLSVLSPFGVPLPYAETGKGAFRTPLGEAPPPLARAAERSRLTGRPQLAAESGSPGDVGQRRYVLFIPLDGAARTPDGSLRRTAAVRGWLCATIDLGAFLRGAEADAGRQLGLTVVDPVDTAAPPLLGTAAGPGAEWTSSLALADTPLELRWRRGEGFLSHRDFAAMGIGAVAALLALTLTMIVASLQGVGERAQELATRMTAELAERERLWQTLAETVPGGIFRADDAGLVVYVNPRGAELLGLSPVAALGQGWLGGVHPDDRAEVAEAWAALPTGVTFHRQFRTQRHGTADTWVTGTGVATRDEDGRVTGYLAVLQDITELKKQQRELIARSKMSSLGEMAAGIAHEVNNPLMIIQGMADQLRRACDRGEMDAVKTRKTVEHIDGTVQRIAKIVSGLRAFARNAERDPLSPATIGSIVDATLGLCAQRFRVRGVEVRVGGALGETLDCRAVQLSQVLLNLLNNSYDAIERLDTKWIDITARATADRVVLTVTDSGARIPDDVAAKIMQPFFTTKPVGRGTGLGLSISKGIVEDHGGSLTLDPDSPNTRFIVTLPKAGEKLDG